jgi:hypothetical protein
MGLGWRGASDDPWHAPITEPKATSWDELVRWLGESGPRKTKASGLRRRRKTKLRERDEYQCRLWECSSRFDRSTSPGKVWIEQGRRYPLPQDRSRREYIGQHLNVHHIVKRENGGRNVPSNLITLCKSCHRELHSQYGEQIPEWEQFIGHTGNDRDFLG